MTTPPPIDPTVPSEFLRIADDLDAIAAAAGDFLAGGLDWTDGSEAAGEVEHEPEFTDDWAKAPVHHVLLMAIQAIHMADDHLAAMAAATRSEHVLFAPLTLTRTVLAACGSAYYLLEPGIGVRVRLARGWTQQLLAYTELMAMFGDDPQSRGFIRAQARRQAIKASAERHGFRVTAPRWKPGNAHASRWYIETKPRPETQLIGDVLAASGQVGVTLWRYTSAFVHAQPHAIPFMLMGDALPVRPGVAQAAVGTGLDRVLLYTTGAALAVDAVIARAAELFGKATDDWQSVVRPIMQRWAQWSRRMRSTDEIPIGEIGRQLGLWLPPTMRHDLGSIGI
jgi:hypothetical protein